ncbi:MAG: peroxidase-related enzyme [Proteobacteria bacterium]|nr:peroxidase-related enzyme [Pseudomonadota bacterium]
MSRIEVVNPKTATGETKQMLDAVQSGLGVVPNFIRALAVSPAALQGFLGLHHISSNGVLDAKTRERLALSVAQQNACQYCVSAHSAIGRKAGLDSAEIQANRNGASSDAKAAAALTFARALVANMGEVTKGEFDAVRNAGHSDAEIMEIIAHVAMNIFTNLIGKATQIEIDFPKIELQKAS